MVQKATTPPAIKSEKRKYQVTSRGSTSPVKIPTKTKCDEPTKTRKKLFKSSPKIKSSKMKRKRPSMSSPKSYGFKEEELSTYELKRLKTIEENKQKMVELGLGRTLPRKKIKISKKTRAEMRLDRYLPGYWTTSTDIAYVLDALNIHSRKPQLPMPYDVLVNRLRRCLEHEETYGNWEAGQINTERSGQMGSHWILAMWCVHGHSTGDVEVVMWESLRHTKYSDHIKHELQSEFKGSQVTLEPTGIQSDGWRCGYISTNWLLYVWGLIINGQVPRDWTPPKPNSGWEDIIHRILRIRDLQRTRPGNAKSIGLKKFVITMCVRHRQTAIWGDAAGASGLH